MDSDRLEEVLRRAERSLDEKDAALIRAVFESYAYVTELVEDKNTSIRRLRQLFFGTRTEKTAAVVGAKAEDSDAPSDSAAAAETGSDAEVQDPAESSESKGATASKGHGRHGADAYRGASRIAVRHPSLAAGDACPACGQGTVYEKAPGVLVRIIGQPPLGATVYELQKLRCHCVVKCSPRPRRSRRATRKYDATAGSMIGLLKYGSGLPFNRLDGLQGNLGVPLPASTQWDVVQCRRSEPGTCLRGTDPAGGAGRGAAQRRHDGEDPGADGTGRPARRGARCRGRCGHGRRSGVACTHQAWSHCATAIASRCSSAAAATRARTWPQVLKHRAGTLPPPIQMCDALSRNLPGELQTILANCLAHARRQFVDVYDRFPEPCRHLLETLAVVYRNDAMARERRLSPEARLQFHQEASGPTMEDLHDWLTRQLDEKRTEPNSALGGAIGYMLKHWDKLTLFLRQAGAPLDNNVCERALKKAILHRKNALFYKTRNGARVGDLFMSLIYTCQLNQANPFDYLTELQRHADELAACPERWMPWNYRDALA